MDKIKKMQEELQKLHSEILEVEKKAETEERDLTAEESEQNQAKLAQMRSLKQTMDYETEKNSLFTELESATERPVTHNEEVKTESNIGFNSFGEYLQAVIRAGSPRGDYIGGERTGVIDPRLLALEERAVSGMSEGISADGGFLVQTDYGNTLIERTYNTGQLVSRTDKYTISKKSNNLKLFGIDETTRAAGSRYGGIVIYDLEEAADKTKSKPKFRIINLELKKCAGLCYLTDELIEDTVALERWVSQKFAEEMAFKMDDDIINGSGVGQPLGILNSNALVSVAKETGQTAATFLAENAEKMYARSYNPGRSIWLINQDVWPQIFQLHHAIGTGGVPVYMPPNGLSGAPYGTLFGRPIVPIEQCQTLGTKGDVYLVDLSQYLWADKGGVQVASSIHVRFTNDEKVLRFVYRRDGQPAWSAKLTPAHGSNTTSPYVALAARA